MIYIYIIQLEQGKYYIGKTKNPQFRLENHFNSNGSEWTKIYKPLSVIEVKPNCDDYEEDKITIQYMHKYGINNVRGGSFVSLKLEESSIETINKMNNGTNNKCFNCGKAGHFAKECKDNKCLETDSDEEYEEVWVCDYCGKEFIEVKKCEYHIKYCNLRYKKKIIYDSDDSDDSSEDEDCCFRCGREGHYASSCYASKHIKGYYLK